MMIHLTKHIDQLDATVHSILNIPDETVYDIDRIFADIRAHLAGKTLVEQGMTADDPATPQIETSVEAPNAGTPTDTPTP